MTLPSLTVIESLALPETERQFLSFFARIVQQYPHNRMLLFAWIFCAYVLDVSSADLGDVLGCTDRNIRYVVAEVRSSQVGEGKTGRPGKGASTEQRESGLPSVTIGLTQYAGLWLLVPWILSSNLLPYCHWLSCTGVVGTPVQLVLTLLAVAACGLERIWVLNDVSDRGFALFTGRWTSLRASQVYTWFKQIEPGGVDLFYQGTKVEEWRLVKHYPAIISNDEHVVGHQGGPEMPKGKVSKNGRKRRAHHLFMPYHLLARRFVGLCVTLTKRKLCHLAGPQTQEMIHARRLAGGDDTPLFEILDRGSYSQHAHTPLMQMHTEGQLDYLAQIKRTSKNVAQWERGLQWGEYTLQPYVRGSEWHWTPAQRHRLCLAQTTTTFSGVPQAVPTLLIIDLDKVNFPDPKAKYAAAFATTIDDPLWIQADLYAWRQDHELAFRDSIHALGLDAKPKGYQKQQPALPLDDPDQSTTLITQRIMLHSWIRALTYNRIRDLLDHLPDPASGWTVLTAARKLIRRTGLLQIQGDCLWVIFDPFPGDKILTPYCAWVNAADFTIPWLNNLKLRLSVADQPIGASLSNAQLRKLLFSP
ncbi:MAG: hypothetical protein GY809_10250 [Planctomycetes bacterium]|nr:hypothetical protein [Planctomycetota bacterium]